MKKKYNISDLVVLFVYKQENKQFKFYEYKIAHKDALDKIILGKPYDAYIIKALDGNWYTIDTDPSRPFSVLKAKTFIEMVTYKDNDSRPIKLTFEELMLLQKSWNQDIERKDKTIKCPEDKSEEYKSGWNDAVSALTDW